MRLDEDKNAVLSPACGRVMEIARVQDDPGVDGSFTRVSIFLAPWDDHATRAPIKGRIANILYRPGKFGVALFKKNLEKNENNLIWINGEKARLAVRQIAGRLARRILCECREGDEAEKGQRIGFITFGSCVQLYLPPRASLRVRVGQKVAAGKTELARLDGASS